ALPRQRFEPKALGSDALAEAVDPGRDGYVIAGIACRAGERKAMGPEVPILGHQEEEALFLVGARRGAGNGHSRARSLRMFGGEGGYRAGGNGMAIFVPVTVVFEFEAAMVRVPVVAKDRLQIEKRDAALLRQVGTHLVQRRGIAPLVRVERETHAIDRQ